MLFLNLFFKKHNCKSNSKPNTHLSTLYLWTAVHSVSACALVRCVLETSSAFIISHASQLVCIAPQPWCIKPNK